MMLTMAPRIVHLLDSLRPLISVRSALPPLSAPQLRNIPRSPMLRQLSRLPSHQILSLCHWLTVRQLQSLFRRHRKPRPLRWIRISRPALGLLHPRLTILMRPLQPRPKHPNAAKWPSKKHPGCRQLIVCPVDFLFHFHYLSVCPSFVV